MDKRTVMKLALDWKNPPYVPWNLNLTIPAEEKLQRFWGSSDCSIGSPPWEKP